MKNFWNATLCLFLSALLFGCVSAPVKSVEKSAPLQVKTSAKTSNGFVRDSVAPGVEIRTLFAGDSLRLPTRAALDFAMYYKNPVREAGKSELPENASPVACDKKDYPFPMFDSLLFMEPENFRMREPLAWEPFTKYLFANSAGDSLSSELRKAEGVKWGQPNVFADFQKVEVLTLAEDSTGAFWWVEVHPRKWTGLSTFWARLVRRPTESEISAYRTYTTETLSREASLDWARALAAYWYPSFNTDLEPLPSDGNFYGKRPFFVMRGNPLGSPLWMAFDVPAFRTVPLAAETLTPADGKFERQTDTASGWRLGALEALQGACPETPETEAFRAGLSRTLDSLPKDQNAWSAGGMLWFRRNANSLLAADFTAQDSLHNPLPRLLELKRFLDSLQIQLLVVPVPTKESVYAERLVSGTPDTLCVDVAGRDFVRKMLASGLDVLDIFPALRAARAGDDENALSFEKTDTHWALPGLLAAMEVLAEKVTSYDWYASSGARPGTLEMRDTTVLREGDLVVQLPGREQGAFSPETLAVKKVYRDGKPYVGGKDSPILLMGDSFTGVFESVDGKSGGPGSLLAFATGLDVQVITSWGGGPGVRHRVVRDKKTLSSKRLVIYMMTMRDFWQSPLEWDAIH